MNRFLTFATLASVAFLILAAQPKAWGGDTNEETQLIGLLRSDHSLQEKDAACARLKWIGTVRSIPVLAELLAEPQLSHSARYALESMAGPEAGNALRQALPKTTGSNEVGIINSLGVRGEATAAPALAALLSSSEFEVAVAAAGALANIGGDKALEALRSAWRTSDTGAAHDAQSDGMLACANRLLTSGEGRQALPVFQELYDHEKDAGIRLAAFRGIILSSGKRGVALMLEAVKGPEGPSQGAALQLASKLGGPATTRDLANLLPKLPEAVQIALLQSLDQRGDPSAAPIIAEMLDNPDPSVRMAAITALGNLGDGKVALRLATQAASATGPEKAAARQALSDLRRGPVTEFLLKPLATAAPEVQSEIIRALGERGDASAAPMLLELAHGESDSTRSGALQALALLAGQAQVPELVQLVVKATNDDTRSEAADALNSACQHIQSQHGRLDAAALAQAIPSAPVESRVALLGVCGGVSDPLVREVLRTASGDPEPRVRGAAIRAMCGSQDEQLLQDVLNIACAAKEANFRMLGVRGCVRLITQEQAAPAPVARNIGALRAILNTTLNAGEKRLVLSGLSSIADIQALDLASPMLEDGEVKVEAADAVIHIAGSISTAHPEEVRAVLKKILAMPVNPATRESAEKTYKKLQ